MTKLKLRPICLAIGALAASFLLSACGGGDDGAESALAKNKVSASSDTILAGNSLSVSALVTMRDLTPKEMKWTIVPLSQSAQGDEPPIIVDPNCTGASLIPPLNPGLSGRGHCSTIVIFPDSLPEGVWRISNLASAQGGTSVAGSMDVYVKAVPDNGFRLLVPTAPVTAYVNRQAQLNVPFTANPGARIENVRYEWSAESSNSVVLAGQRNSTATIVPSSPGQYKFNVKVTATVNGIRTERNASIVVIAEAAPIQEVIEAGTIKTAIPGDVVELVGNILNRNEQLSYTFSWSQLPGASGGPERVTLANSNSQIASFVVPQTPGTYGFEFSVHRQNLDGTITTTKSQTYVVAKAAGLPFFNLSVTPALLAATGESVVLSAEIAEGDSGDDNNDLVRYTYRWRQVGSSPTSVTLSGANTASPSFVPTVAGTYTFEVEVTGTNARGRSVTVVTQVQVVVS